jgi:hypothetical protein
VNAGRIAIQLFAGALSALGAVLRVVGAVAGNARTETGGHVRTSAGVEPAATDENGQLVGAYSGSPAIEIVTGE